MHTPEEQIRRVNQHLAEIQKELYDLRLQMGLFEGRLKSEHGNMTRHIDDMYKKIERMEAQVHSLQLWKSNVQGREYIKGFVVGALIAITTSVIVWLITKA